MNISLNHIRAALTAHMQNWQSHNFEKTHYGKKLAGLKGIHNGNRCVIVGNGPSLRAEDLETLYRLNIPTFGTNRIYQIYSQTKWRPTYYAAEDPDVIRNVQQEVSDIQAQLKLIPINLKWYHNIHIKDADYFYMDYSSDFKDTCGISMNIPHCIRCMSTVTATCMHFAIYMGFSEIYLLGVDHNYANMIDRNGNVLKNTVSNHFSKQYDKGMLQEPIRIDDVTMSYLKFEELSHKSKNFKVFNATRGGKLEVFERVDFDRLFPIILQ